MSLSPSRPAFDLAGCEWTLSVVRDIERHAVKGPWWDYMYWTRTSNSLQSTRIDSYTESMQGHRVDPPCVTDLHRINAGSQDGSTVSYRPTQNWSKVTGWIHHVLLTWTESKQDHLVGPLSFTGLHRTKQSHWSTQNKNMITWQIHNVSQPWTEPKQGVITLLNVIVFQRFTTRCPWGVLPP